MHACVQLMKRLTVKSLEFDANELSNFSNYGYWVCKSVHNKSNKQICFLANSSNLVSKVVVHWRLHVWFTVLCISFDNFGLPLLPIFKTPYCSACCQDIPFHFSLSHTACLSPCNVSGDPCTCSIPWLVSWKWSFAFLLQYYIFKFKKLQIKQNIPVNFFMAPWFSFVPVIFLYTHQSKPEVLPEKPLCSGILELSSWALPIFIFRVAKYVKGILTDVE